MANAHDVAAAIIDRTGRITSMKLQKLVYYAQAWQLVFHHKALFEDRIEAWVEGPVTRTLSEAHRGQFYVDKWPRGNPKALTGQEVKTIEWVLGKYSKFSAEALSRMTHMDSPWRVTRGILPDGSRSSEEIPRERMRTFYSRQRSDPEVAVAQAAASAALEGAELNDEWQQVLRDVANGSADPSAVIEAEIRRVRGTC